jgi:phosphatidate cytidylyltransferase
MKNRIISGVVIGILFAAIVIFNSTFPYALNIAIAIISVLCVHELVNASGLTKHWALYYPSLGIAIVLPFTNLIYHGMILSYCIYSLIMFLSLIIYHKTITFKELSIIYSMSIMIPTSLLTIISTRDLSSTHGIFYSIVAILAAWIPDIGAYFTGTLLGKHKLCPEISPKKTVEGFIGGIVFGVLFMMLTGFIFTHMFTSEAKQVSYAVLALLGLGGSMTSTIGDLSFSLIKRSCGVKDFGNIIPGHGGMLDRFDSVIFTAPYVYLIVSYMPMVL